VSATDLSLADLVGDVEVFAAEHWGRRTLHRSSDLDLTALLDVEAVERLLLTSARRPTFRLVQDGERLPPERSTSPIRLGGTTLDDVADVAKIAEAVDGGATLVLQGLQRTWPPLIQLCRHLEQELSHPVQANAYLTPARASGLARHHDEHDVLVLQLAGRKGWEVDQVGPLTLVPGDVLYLPAGTAHAAGSQDEPSLHLTIGVLRVTYGQVVRRLLDRLEDVDLSAPLPIGYANRARALEDGLREQIAATERALGQVDIGAVAGYEQQRARRRRPPSGAGQLRSVLGLDALDTSTVVRCRADHAAWLDDHLADGRLVLHLHDREVHIPVEARPAIEVLLGGTPTKVGELPGLSDASRLVVVARLVREGLVVIEG